MGGKVNLERYGLQESERGRDGDKEWRQEFNLDW